MLFRFAPPDAPASGTWINADSIAQLREIISKPPADDVLALEIIMASGTRHIINTATAGAGTAEKIVAFFKSQDKMALESRHREPEKPKAAAK